MMAGGDHDGDKIYCLVADGVAREVVLCVNPVEPATYAARDERGDDALQAAADGTYTDASQMPALCHTCRIVKPMRSKHCTIAKRCVPMFDHYCPYINNTIGGGNYIYFVRFIALGLVSVPPSVHSAVASACEPRSPPSPPVMNVNNSNASRTPAPTPTPSWLCSTLTKARADAL